MRSWEIRGMCGEWWYGLDEMIIPNDYFFDSMDGDEQWDDGMEWHPYILCLSD